MIRIIEEIEGNDYVRIPLENASGGLLIEVASNRALDFAVMNAEKYKRFEETDEDDPDVQWYEAVHFEDIEFTAPNSNEKFYLVVWNANSKKAAFVAYRVSPLQTRFMRAALKAETAIQG